MGQLGSRSQITPLWGWCLSDTSGKPWCLPGSVGSVFVTKSLLPDLHQPICLQQPAQHQKHPLLDTEKSISHIRSFWGSVRHEDREVIPLYGTSYSYQHLICPCGHTNSTSVRCDVLQSPAKGPALQDTACLTGVTLPLALLNACLCSRVQVWLSAVDNRSQH